MKNKYTLKTQPTDKDPLQVINMITNERKRADAITLLKLFVKAVGMQPVVWGEKFIGFGTYQYCCKSGYSAEIYATGFSVTNRKITLHLFLDDPQLQDCLKRLGKITSTKSCVYMNNLTDVDMDVLTELIKKAFTLDKE